MLFLNFLYAAALLAIGIAALNTGLPLEEAPLAYTGIFFGGSALICALFALKARRHGLMGAAFLAFVALLTGLSRLFALIREQEFRFADPQNKLLGAFLGITFLYLVASVRHWRQRPFTAPE